VPVADRERTLADALVHPEWVGGIRHLAEMMTTYRESSEADPTRLVESLSELGRGAAFKRLGYLAETLWPEAVDLIEAARDRRSTGLIALDPSVRTKGRINKRWGLRINASVGKRARTE
jgi:predicted transcriptional regulator of viral defense system